MVWTLICSDPHSPSSGNHFSFTPRLSAGKTMCSTSCTVAIGPRLVDRALDCIIRQLFKNTKMTVVGWHVFISFLVWLELYQHTVTSSLTGLQQGSTESLQYCTSQHSKCQGYYLRVRWEDLAVETRWIQHDLSLQCKHWHHWKTIRTDTRW